MSRTTRKALCITGLLIIAACVAVLATSRGRNIAWSLFIRTTGGVTIEDRLAQFGPAARDRMFGSFNAIGMAYPPPRVALLAFKEERVLEVYVTTQPDDSAWQWVNSYAIVGASGTAGPKLAEGDRQVPEGIYGIESLNPNSRFHLSLRVSYPNDADRARAREDQRTNLGGDIMIHGGSSSIGCLAMGDEAIEELFVLAAETGIENVQVVISPRDLRQRDRDGLPNSTKWIGSLYDEIEASLGRFPPLRVGK